MKKSFQCIGNSSNGYLTMLDKEGVLWIYDGYELEVWNSNPIANSTFIEAIFLQDSVFFAYTKDALLLFTSENPKPSVLNKSTEHYFSRIKNQNLYVSHEESYTMHNNGINPVNIQQTPLRRTDYVVDDQEDVFFNYLGRLIWTQQNGQDVTNIPIPDFDQILVDKWNRKWVLSQDKLFQLIVTRDNPSAEMYNFNDFAADQLKAVDDGIYGLYNDHSICIENAYGMMELCTSEGWKIVDFWVDDREGIWVLDTKSLMHHFDGKKWYSWPKSEITIQDKIIGIHVDEDVYSIVFENNGVLQSRRRDEVSDWIWVPHRLNAKLKNIEIRASCQQKNDAGDSKLFFFTENFGIVVVDKKEFGIIKDGIPGYGISKVRIYENSAVLLDKGKRWYLFHFGQAERKSVEKIESAKLPPEITSAQFLFDGQKVIYLSEGALVQLDIDSGVTVKWPYTGTLDHAIITENYVIETENGNIKRMLLPEKIIERVEPQLLTVELVTAQDYRYSIWPKSAVKYTLKSSDFPVVLEAKASYVPSPKDIEFAWSETTNKSFSTDYKFSNSTRWKLRELGSQQLQLNIKIDDKESIYKLSPINIIEDVVVEDNSWAIYLSAILAGLLGTILIVARVRSKRQSRKISALQVEKRSLELEQKALQLQMNPHFIFNALNGVKGMIALGEDKKARQYLTKTSSWIRNMLNDARAEKIEIAREVVNLTSYMEIERELQGQAWDFEVTVESDINQAWKIAPMMIQPFIENAIIHAFKGIDYKGKVALRLDKRGPNIRVIVEDNGVGLQQKSQAGHESVALNVIRNRLKFMHQGTAAPKLTLINKKEEDNSETGVIVSFELPILD